MNKCVLSLLLCVIYLPKFQCTDTNPVVAVEDGKIQGQLVTPDNGKPHYAFKEIPYAAPPIGDLRLAEPIPPQKWGGVRDATKNTKICNCKKVTFQSQDPRENEDCLYLNVFTPKVLTKNHSLLPVYFYIYGGAYICGDPTEYNFQGFLDENIVVVTLSYRSTLGFITTADDVIPGNIGIKDQLLALKWVQKNILQFGGDPSKVTIGGHSSGAILAGFHLLNSKAKGLFRSAILQSGSPLLESSHNSNPRYFAYALGQQLSADFSSKNTSQDLLKLLRSVPVEKIIETDVPIPDSLIYRHAAYRSPYVPAIEDPNYENAVVTGPMHENYKNGISNHLPVLIGITSEEAIKMHNLTAKAFLANEDLTSMIPPSINVKKENVLPMAKEIKDIYSKDKSYIENIPGFANALSDVYFSIPISNNAYLHSKYSDVYFYQFSYKSRYNGEETWKQFHWFDPEKNGKAGHTDELPLLYDYRLNPGVSPTLDDVNVSKMMIKLWTNFIKYTNPTPHKDPLLQNTTWPLVKQDNFRFLDINSNLSIRKNPSRLIDWQNRMEKYFETPRYSY